VVFEILPINFLLFLFAVSPLRSSDDYFCL
jgi:hypothetical protein